MCQKKYHFLERIHTCLRINLCVACGVCPDGVSLSECRRLRLLRGGGRFPDPRARLAQRGSASAAAPRRGATLEPAQTLAPNKRSGGEL